MAINSKNTKAEILAAYVELRDKPIAASDVLAWTLQTLLTTSRETRLLIKDCYGLGQAFRAWYDQTVYDLTRPIIKA